MTSCVNNNNHPSSSRTLSTTASDGMLVQVNYTGKLEDGSIFDSSEGKDPLAFTLGAGEMIPGFDKAVKGMTIGESKDIKHVQYLHQLEQLDDSWWIDQPEVLGHS